ncbi:hypothetical protein PC110_g19611 [Phytophthora cactorum]|uniref:Uncharacterized protein n=1 Tax=Phytophthora cactorum TaxID=29920 RepID=A0A329RJU1_9STRA|nr:hypothetical protein PC110_g19611 [Phytophthora cactorum]
MKDSESFGVRGVLGAWWNTGAGWNTIELVRAESAKLAQVWSGGRVMLLVAV